MINPTILATAGLALLAANPATASPSRPIPSSCNGTWEDLGPIALHERQEHTVVALNASTIALVGGIILRPGGGDGSLPTDWETTDIFQLYDTKTKAWALGHPLPVAINHPNTAVIDGKVYLLGGLVESPDGNWVASGASYVFEPGRAAAWRTLSPMPAGTERGSAAVGAHHGRIYLAGGLLNIFPQDTVASVVAYDIAADAWVTTNNSGPNSLPTAAAALPEGRDHAGAAVIDATLYVVGGRVNGQHNVRDTVFALDMARLERGWKTRAGRMPTPRGGIAAAAVGGKIYTFGGEGNPAEGSGGVFPDTESYDVRTDKWEVLAPMAVPRHGTFAVALGGGVYIPGGGTRESGSATDKFDVFWPSPPSRRCDGGAWR